MSTVSIPVQTGRGRAAEDRPWSADPYAHALSNGRGPLFLRRTDGWLLPLDVERWCADADAADLEVLRRCEGAVLDVGCGPGRLVAALGRQGRRVLGIDVSEAAVARTVRRLGSSPPATGREAGDGPVLLRSVFEPLPDEGHWGTALLFDGNIGIGGDPRALLDRMAQLLSPHGLLIAETVPDLDLDERVQVQVTDARGALGHPFRWARLGTPALLRHAERAGWCAVDEWAVGGRSFVALRRRDLTGHARRFESPRHGTSRLDPQRPVRPAGTERAVSANPEGHSAF
ncbi:class I SAM-dependent methyltransferase [Streptomyces sp. ISL-22]|uniref:class I SAM-dependent methyltransferase n=1 Tax=unclassified Streptomyces TaxID=2593676 RepID=UPI001BEC2148|nr:MULTISPECIES: class I SAM-dependent methyltransferase [unclassified Streptomyces]MBT2422760.1 class I SAM-dependent methyltransferase [Streptomyces sp. ISL-24]MBT2431472.1 class I SAM-dependent methyltransferase [Streptomyces sp. ISL-22]